MIRKGAKMGSARLGSARLGSARLGSARLGSARLGSAVVLRLFQCVKLYYIKLLCKNPEAG